MVQFLSYSRYSSNASDQGSVLLITRGFSGKGNFVDFKFTRSQQSQKKNDYAESLRLRTSLI